MNYKYCKDFRQKNYLQTYSRSSAIMPFDSPYMISYLSSIVTMSFSCTVSEILSIISENLKTSRDRDHAHSREGCNPNAKQSSGELVYKI